MCRAENKASNHRSAKTLSWPPAMRIHTRGAGNQDEWRRPLPHCPSSGRSALALEGAWRGGCRVSKHSPTILTAGRPVMCKKEKRKKKQSSDGWSAVQYLPWLEGQTPAALLHQTPPLWEAQPGKTNSPCHCSLTAQLELKCQCDGVQI